MKLKLFFFLLIPFLGVSQVQIGQTLLGDLPGDEMGYSVAISANGKIIAMGAPGNDGNGTNSGLVRVYENIAGVWMQLGTDIYGGNYNSWGPRNGFSVSLSADGKILAMGAPYNGPGIHSSGYVRVFKYISGSWSQIGSDIGGPISQIDVGASVSLSADGNTIAVGAYGPTPLDFPGHVSVYKNFGGIWVQVGNNINGKNNGDCFGRCVSISDDGNTVAIGAAHGSTSIPGYAGVYKNISGVWTQVGQDLVSKNLGDFYGQSVSLSSNGNLIAVGSPMGLVNVFENISGVWSQVGNDIKDSKYPYSQSLGRSVSLSSDGKLLALRGDLIAKIYENINNNWIQKGVDIYAGQNQYYGWAFGLGISISKDATTVVIGAPAVSNQTGSVKTYDLTKTASSNQFVLDNFNIYPNPASDILKISLESNLVFEKAVIYNNLGQIVKEANQEVINVSELAKGIYYVEVTTNQGKATKKVIIK